MAKKNNSNDAGSGETSVMLIRVPEDTRSVVDTIIKIQGGHGQIKEVAAMMLTEYSSIKKLMINPLMISRRINIGKSGIVLEPCIENNNIKLNLYDGEKIKHSLTLNKEDKESIHALIANLLLFTNTI